MEYEYPWGHGLPYQGQIIGKSLVLRVAVHPQDPHCMIVLRGFGASDQPTEYTEFAVHTYRLDAGFTGGYYTRSEDDAIAHFRARIA